LLCCNGFNFSLKKKLLNLSEFVALLADKKFVPRAEQRSELVAFANYVISERNNIGAEDQKWFVGRLKPLSRSPNRFKSAITSQLLYWFTKAPSALIQGVHSALLDGSGIEGRVANMNGLGAMLFNGSEGSKILASEINRPRLKAYYLETVAMMRKALSEKRIAIKSQFAPNNRVVILTQQFLRPPHAPTKDTLEFARILKENFGKEVLIVSSCEFNSHPSGSVLPLFLGNVLNELSGNRSIDYSGHAFSYFQPPQNRFSVESIGASVEKIEEFDPAMILVVGARNLLAEMFADRAFVLFYPTTANVPLCHEPYFFMWRPPSESELSMLQAEGISERFLFHQHPGFEPPKQTTTLTRQALGLPSDAFIFVVVGMRLDADVKDDFLDMLENLVEVPGAHIAFAGNFSHYAQVVAEGRQKLAGRTTFLGFQDDMMSVYSLCDVYLNPKRTGGGSAIVYAMATGLPPLSCPVGDGYEAARNLPLIADYNEMVRVAKLLVFDRQKYEEYQAMAKAEAVRLCSRLPLVERIMQSYDEFVARRAAG
jgi:glycosyltransferase involved in cell wall biosynthesis